MNAKHAFFTTLALLFTFAAAGCNAVRTPPAAAGVTGSLTLSATLEPRSASSATSARITATNAGMVRETVVPVTGSVLTGAFSGLPVGDWLVTVELIDELGNTTHVGESTVRIYPNETVTVQITARPVEAQVEIVADLHGFPDAESIGHVKVTFQNDRTLTLNQEEGDPLLFTGVKELPAGDYEFSISLYTSSTYADDRVYISPWTHVRLDPGKTSRVTWQAQTGDTTIDTSIVDLPLTPINLTLETSGEELWLRWEIGGEPPAAFRIYYRSDVYAPYEMIAEVTGGVYEYPVSEELPERATGSLAVTAVSAAGIEGYRSEAVHLSPGK